MNSREIYQLICFWISRTYLSNVTLNYDETLYQDTLTEFVDDYRRWYSDDIMIDLHKLNMTVQLHPVLTYRLARSLYLRGDEMQASVYSALGRIHGQIEIYYSARIGKGLKINHGGGSVVGARCVIGDNCLLHQGVTLGDKNGGRPTIGNNVIIYPGAKILGPISIGDDSIIGANAVCLSSTPPRSVCVGIPARNIAEYE